MNDKTDADDGLCPSTWPPDPSIQCERPAGHSKRMLHCNGEYRPDGPYYEWEDQ